MSVFGADGSTSPLRGKSRHRSFRSWLVAGNQPRSSRCRSLGLSPWSTRGLSLANHLVCSASDVRQSKRTIRCASGRLSSWETVSKSRNCRVYHLNRGTPRTAEPACTPDGSSRTGGLETAAPPTDTAMWPLGKTQRLAATLDERAQPQGATAMSMLLADLRNWGRVARPLQAIMRLDFPTCVGDDILGKVDRTGMPISLGALSIPPSMGRRLGVAHVACAANRIGQHGGKLVLRRMLARMEVNMRANQLILM